MEEEAGPPSAAVVAGAGEAKQARGSGSESSYSVGKYPEMVAHKVEPVRSKMKDEMVGYAYRCVGPEPRVRRVWNCSEARTAGSRPKVKARSACSFPVSVSEDWTASKWSHDLRLRAYLVHGDSTRDVDTLEVIAVRRSPSSPSVNQGQVAAFSRIDKHFGRERMMLHVVHAVPVRDDGDGATGIVGPVIELAEGTVRRGRDVESGVVRVRRDRVDGAFVVEPDLGGSDPAVAVAAPAGGIFQVVSKDDRIVSATKRGPRVSVASSGS